MAGTTSTPWTTRTPSPASRSREARDGLRDVAPAMVAAIPIGLLFGALSAAKGLSVLEVALMCALVFAGGAQFAAVEIWSYPVPVAALAFSTLLINARHVLMGASLAPQDRALRALAALLGFAVLADENWAFAERRAARHRSPSPTSPGWARCSGRTGSSGRASAPCSGRSSATRSGSAPTSPSRPCSSA